MSAGTLLELSIIFISRFPAFAQAHTESLERDTIAPSPMMEKNDGDCMSEVDILRFGADVAVLEPADMRSRVKRALHDAAGRYV